MCVWIGRLEGAVIVRTLVFATPCPHTYIMTQGRCSATWLTFLKLRAMCLCIGFVRQRQRRPLMLEGVAPAGRAFTEGDALDPDASTLRGGALASVLS